MEAAKFNDCEIIRVSNIDHAYTYWSNCELLKGVDNWTEGLDSEVGSALVLKSFLHPDRHTPTRVYLIQQANNSFLIGEKGLLKLHSEYMRFNIQATEKDDHEGQVYNPYTNTWNWF